MIELRGKFRIALTKIKKIEKKSILDKINKIAFDLTEDKIEQLLKLQTNLRQIKDQQLEGCMVRSRLRWTIDGKNHRIVL